MKNALMMWIAGFMVGFGIGYILALKVNGL